MKECFGDLRRTGVRVGSALLALTVVLGSAPAKAATCTAPHDSLYVSDQSDNTVKRFDAVTGAYLGDFVTSSSGGLLGPNGIIFVRGKFFVANQNANTPNNGNILEYNGTDGDFLSDLFLDTNAHAPFNPHGIIHGFGHTLYVADVDGGKVIEFNDLTGAFLGNLVTTGYTGGFNPEAVVIGPDGLLYVSVDDETDSVPKYSILRFTPYNGKFLDVFTSNEATGCAANLYKPGGLTFGLDGNLYVASYASGTTDTDKILVFSPTGSCISTKTIVLDTPGGVPFQPQGIVFGPNGGLYAAGSAPFGTPNSLTGEIRVYNVSTKAFTVFAKPKTAGGPLGNPEFLTFGETDPMTLAYGFE